MVVLSANVIEGVIIVSDAFIVPATSSFWVGLKMPIPTFSDVVIRSASTDSLTAVPISNLIFFVPTLGARIVVESLVAK